MIETLETNIEAVVILGAGLDTLAYRHPQLSMLKVYEVDFPENIHYKKKKLETLYGAVPTNITLVQVDFEGQNIETVLKQAGYSFERRTFFVWEGVTQYLGEAAVRDTFQCLTKAQPGSRLVFTYVLKDFIDSKNTYGLNTLYQRFRVKHQWWLFGIQPQGISEFVGEYSWKVLEHVGADEFSRRYLKPVGRTTSVDEIEQAAYAEKLPH